jgi:hypothetical protein
MLRRSELVDRAFESDGDVSVAGETLCDVVVADELLPGGDPEGRKFVHSGRGRR